MLLRDFIKTLDKKLVNSSKIEFIINMDLAHNGRWEFLCDPYILDWRELRTGHLSNVIVSDPMMHAENHVNEDTIGDPMLHAEKRVNEDTVVINLDYVTKTGDGTVIYHFTQMEQSYARM